MNIFQCCFGFMLASSLVACVKDRPNPDPVIPREGIQDKMWIINEGSLGNGNASLSLFDLSSKIIYPDVYHEKNEKYLGDIFQSMVAYNDELFLAINNSDKIIVIDKESFEYKREISVSKPRYMVIKEDVLFVSSIYNSKVFCFDVNSSQLIKEINFPYKNTEGLLLTGNKLWVSIWNESCNKIYIVNTDNLKVADSALLGGYAPQHMLQDKNGDFWVFGGNVEMNRLSSVTKLNGTDHSIVAVHTFPEKAEIIKPIWNTTRDTVYFLGVNYEGTSHFNGAYRFAINQHLDDLDAPPFISAKKLQYYWALGVDTVHYNIWLGDPKGFIQKGRIEQYNMEGMLLDTYDVGIGPSSFYFSK